MKKACRVLFSAVIICIVIISTANAQAGKDYKPDDPVLYNAIVRMDSLFFGAYNNCDIKLQASIFADTIEFYHDHDGLITNKQLLLDAIKNNICGKVTRELVKGSIEVYPLGKYGAVEIGMHVFHNKLEPNPNPHPGKFICIWHFENNSWRLSRVVSLH